MHDLHLATVEKVKYLEGYVVVQVWECDIKRELERDEEMKRYFNNYKVVDPLEPRDAFFGGDNFLLKNTIISSVGEKPNGIVFSLVR